MSELAVQCVGLSKRFGNIVAAEDLDLEVARGQFLALLGPSGCGKTTTLRLIAGFERPDRGTVEIAAVTVVGPGVFVPPERRRVGMVFQEGALFPHMDVAANIAYGLPPSGDRLLTTLTSQRWRKPLILSLSKDGPAEGQRLPAARVDDMLEMVGLAGYGRRMPHELSGGQQQRVALARALAPEPAVVLLDEPFSNLDAALRARVRGEVRTILRRAGATAVFVTHDQDEALSLADEVVVMWHGRVVQRATPQELYRKPATRDVASFLGEAVFLIGHAEGSSVATELGVLMADSAEVSGTVDVLVRPEAIRLFLDGASEGRVTDAEFYGHDRMFWVDFPDGSRIRARITGSTSIRLGDHVRIQIQGPVSTFPRG